MHKPVLITAPAELAVTLARVKAWLWVDHSAHDSMITDMIKAATALMDGHAGVLGRAIINQTWRQDFADWPASTDNFLRLPFPDVSSIVSVKYSDVANVEQTVDAALYQLLEDERGSYLRMTDDFTDPALYDDRIDPVRVTFVAGFGADSDAVPQGLQAGIMQAVANWYKTREGDHSSLPKGVTSAIAPWRRVPV